MDNSLCIMSGRRLDKESRKYIEYSHYFGTLRLTDPIRLSNHSRGKGKAGKEFMLAQMGFGERKRVMLHERAGLQFPVGRIKRKMSYMTYNQKISITSAGKQASKCHLMY
jgi:hypothetical protein